MIELTFTFRDNAPEIYRHETPEGLVRILPPIVNHHLALARMDTMDGWGAPLYDHIDHVADILDRYVGPMTYRDILHRIEEDLALRQLTDDMLRPENAHSDEGAILSDHDWEITVREVSE